MTAEQQAQEASPMDASKGQRKILTGSQSEFSCLHASNKAYLNSRGRDQVMQVAMKAQHICLCLKDQRWCQLVNVDPGKSFLVWVQQRGWIRAIDVWGFGPAKTPRLWTGIIYDYFQILLWKKNAL